jgi:hypothetical protein
MCGSYFAADVRGRLTNPRTTLNACLTSNNLNNTIGSGNIEILEASLVNCDTGLVFATSGIIQN